VVERRLDAGPSLVWIRARATPEERDRYNELAERLDTSLSDLIRDLLDERMQREAKRSRR
jgi:hypothetical protein